MGVLDELRQSVIDGDMDRTQALVQEAIAEEVPAEQILTAGLISAMTEVGRLFECGESYVPEMLVAARAMKSGLTLLRPRLIAAHVRPVGKVIIGTVQGDIHDIGKNLVGMMLEGAGFEVIDLGTDVGPEAFAAAVRAHRPQLVGLSALLTTTMQVMKSTLEALEDLGVRAQVRVMVGGAPVTEAFAREIGADGYAADASRAVALAKSLL